MTLDLDTEMQLERLFIDLNASIQMASRYRNAGTPETMNLANNEVVYSLGVLKEIQTMLDAHNDKDNDDVLVRGGPEGLPDPGPDGAPGYL